MGYRLRATIDRLKDISQPKAGKLLSELGYNLQSNKKTREGNGHPDRNAQFEHINEVVKVFQESGLPPISVDTRKKEKVENFFDKNYLYKDGYPAPPLMWWTGLSYEF